MATTKTWFWGTAPDTDVTANVDNVWDNRTNGSRQKNQQAIFWIISTDTMQTLWEKDIPAFTTFSSVTVGLQASHQTPTLSIYNKDATVWVTIDPPSNNMNGGTKVGGDWHVDTSWHTLSCNASSFFPDRSTPHKIAWCATAANNKADAQIKNRSITWTGECPYFTIRAANVTGGTVSNTGSTDIVRPNTTYSRAITAVPSANYHFVRWDFSDGRQSSTNNPYTFSYSDQTITAHTTSVTATPVFALNPNVHVRTSTDDGGALPEAAFTGTDTATDAYYAYNSIASRTAKTLLADAGRNTIYEFVGWKIYKGNVTSGTAAKTSNNATYSYTFTSANYTAICDANAETTWIAYYERRFFLEVTKPDAVFSYAIKNMDGVNLASVGDGMTSDKARYAIPQTGCTISITILNPRYTLDNENTGVTNSTYGSTSVENRIVTVTTKAGQSTVPVAIRYEQSYWMLTITGNDKLPADPRLGANVYVTPITITNDGGTMIDETHWLISVANSATFTANTNTSYDASMSFDNEVVVNGPPSSYTIAAGELADHSAVVTTRLVTFNVTATLYVGSGEIDPSINLGSIDVPDTVERYGSVTCAVTPADGYVVSRFYVGATNKGALNQYTYGPVNGDVLFSVELTTEVGRWYRIYVHPPRFGDIDFWRVYNSATLYNVQSGATADMSIGMLRSNPASFFIQARYNNDGWPYAFACKYTFNNEDHYYVIPVKSVAVSGGKTTITSERINIPTERDHTITVYTAYRKNHVFLTDDQTIQPNDLWVGGRRVREVVVQNEDGACVVWENETDTPFADMIGNVTFEAFGPNYTIP